MDIKEYNGTSLAYMGDALGYSQYDRPLCTGVLVGIALNDVQQGLIQNFTEEE